MALGFVLSIAVAAGQLWFVGTAPQNRNTIEGRVVTRDHQPLSEVRVFLQNDSYSQLGSAYTDASGRFRFVNLVSGVYYVQVEPGALNFERQTQRIEAVAFTRRASGAGEVFRVDFVLKPNEGEKGSGKDSIPAEKSVVFFQPVPEAAKKEYASALKNLEKDNFKEAAAALNRAIGIYAEYYDALELLGTEYVKRQQYQPAADLLQRAVAVNKDGWRAFYSLGIADDELHKREEAIQCLRRAVELNPDSPNAAMRLGVVLAQSGETRAEAIHSFESVVKLAKDKIPTAYFYLGVLYAKNNQFREAADALETFLRVYPQAGERDKIKQMIDDYRKKAKSQKST